ncbi:MAG: AAA family ATPase [Spirochaetota bacterium]
MVINENEKKKIIPVAGGKGGVGKTLIAANLAIQLARNNKKTVVVDLDMGGANLHTCLGIKNNNPGIGNLLSGSGMSFEDLIVRTPYENLRFIPGDVMVAGMADITTSQRKKVISGLLDIESDYIIMDLATGSSCNVIDFFLVSNSGFLVTSHQTMSILNTFEFLKSMIFRYLQSTFNSNKKVSGYLKKMTKEKRPNSQLEMSRTLQELQKLDQEAEKKAREALSMLKPQLIINMADSSDDLEIIQKLRNLVKTSLEIDLGCLGMVYSDQRVSEALEESTPVVEYDQQAIFSREIERIAQKIIQSESFPDMPLDLDYYSDSFELARIEADNDREEIQASQKPEEEFDVGELLSIISQQKKQIQELRGTVRMLTMKNP